MLVWCNIRRPVDAILIVYSSASFASFNTAIKIFKKYEHKRRTDGTKLYLVANQSDLHEDRIIGFSSAKYVSDQLGTDGLFDVSAKHVADVLALFRSVVSDKTEVLWPVSTSYMLVAGANFVARLARVFSRLPFC